MAIVPKGNRHVGFCLFTAMVGYRFRGAIMTDERIPQITPHAVIAADSAFHPVAISARTPKRRSGARSKKISAVSIVGHSWRFQVQVSRIRPTKTARARRIVS